MKRFKVGGVDIDVRLNFHNWALPLSFGGGIWADEEIGDYGARYGCEWMRCVIVSILCLSVKFEWFTEDPEAAGPEVRG